MRPEWWSRLWERYVDSQADYRASLETLARKMIEADTDAQQLLGWLATPAAQEFAGGTQAQLLARVWGEQFEVVAGTGATQPKTKEQLSSARVQNPHDPDATYAAKGTGDQKKEHVGYKVQVAETVTEAVLAPGQPTGNFISGILTHAARESDEEGALKMEQEQQAMGLDKPPRPVCGRGLYLYARVDEGGGGGPGVDRSRPWQSSCSMSGRICSSGSQVS